MPMNGKPVPQIRKLSRMKNDGTAWFIQFDSELNENQVKLLQALMKDLPTHLAKLA